MTEPDDLFGWDPAIVALLDAVPAIAPEEARVRWPQTLVELIDVCVAALARRGFDAATAWGHATVIVCAIAAHLGRRVVYVPAIDDVERMLRDRRIWHEFRGHNLAALSQRYQLSEVRLYQIIAEQRALNRRRLQPDLFGTGS
jgi:Mor family transcriptional regulator